MSNKRERRVSTRVRGLELALLEQSKLSNGEIVRYGLRKYFDEHPIKNEHKILTEISFLQDENQEYELKIEANELLIQKRISELAELRNNHEKLVYDRLIMGMYDLLIDFMDDDRYTFEVRSDLNEFYSLYRDSISLLAMKFNKTNDEAIELFEQYLDSFDNEDSVLLNKDKVSFRS